ncbi:hypothetical protein [Streptomyces bacillaris]|uniref:hypothetical protein n=1 Tax=Streptomyces bacillaris TaxID=68179 RepID=UPI003818612F
MYANGPYKDTVAAATKRGSRTALYLLAVRLEQLREQPPPRRTRQAASARWTDRLTGLPRAGWPTTPP